MSFKIRPQMFGALRCQTIGLFGGALFILQLLGCIPQVVEPILIDYEASTYDLTEPNEILGGFQQLLDEYITGSSNQKIDYQKLTQDTAAREQLDRFLAWAGQLEIRNPDYMLVHPNRPTAFYINVHNALVLRGILACEPLEKLSELAGDFFEIVKFKMGDEILSLQQIAQRSQADRGWRVAFALAGPNRSDPFFAETLYTPENLSQQLAEAVQNYIGSCAGMRIDHARRRVLLGKLLYERQGFFLRSYYDRTQLENVSMVSALVPWASRRTQEQLVDLAGYKIAPQKWDDRLNQVVEDEEPAQGIDEYICGIK